MSVSVYVGKNIKNRPLSSVSPAATTLSRPSHYWPERDKHGVEEITIELHTHTDG